MTQVLQKAEELSTSSENSSEVRPIIQLLRRVLADLEANGTPKKRSKKGHRHAMRLITIGDERTLKCAHCGEEADIAEKQVIERSIITANIVSCGQVDLPYTNIQIYTTSTRIHMQEEPAAVLKSLSLPKVRNILEHT